MFDFFKKKKKNTEDKAEQNTPSPEETTTEVADVQNAQPVQVEPEPNAQTASEDAEKKEATPAATDNVTPTAAKLPQEDIQAPDIHIRVSKDNLSAFLKVKTYDNNQEVDSQQVLDALTNIGIKKGIMLEEIIAYCKKREYYSEAEVARGVEPIAGNDGFITYMFETVDVFKLIENEAGVVNFRELNVIKSVHSGDLLCKVTPPTDGTSGTNVYGDPILPKLGKPADLKYGENTELSADGLELKATLDGCIDYNSTTKNISVTELYTVRGDVSSAVGNLDCLGSIVINGDVREGFIVKAKKDIHIKGVIEGAHIVAGGTITISNGMNGMGNGTITAGGDIISKYFENTEITSTNGTVFSDVIINSNVTAGNSVILKGGKGSLIGGTCTVGKMVYAAHIGARTNVPTSVVIESKEFREALIPDQENVKKKEALKAELNNLEADKMQVESKLAELKGAPNQEDPPIVAAVKAMTLAVTDVNAEIKAVSEKIAETNSEASALSEYKVVATKTCFSGVKISMAYLYTHCEDDYAATKFFISDHKIIPGQILPSDKLN